MEPHDDAPNSLRERFMRGIFALVALVIFYVLSIGPAQGFFFAKFVTLTLLPDGSYLQRVDGPLAHFYAPVTQTMIAAGLWPMLSTYCQWWHRIANRCYGK